MLWAGKMPTANQKNPTRYFLNTFGILKNTSRRETRRVPGGGRIKTPVAVSRSGGTRRQALYNVSCSKQRCVQQILILLIRYGVPFCGPFRPLYRSHTGPHLVKPKALTASIECMIRLGTHVLNLLATKKSALYQPHFPMPLRPFPNRRIRRMRIRGGAVDTVPSLPCRQTVPPMFYPLCGSATRRHHFLSYL